MRAVAAAAVAEIAAGLGHRPRRDAQDFRFGGDIEDSEHLLWGAALVVCRFSYRYDEIALALIYIFLEIWQVHPEHGKRRVRANIRRQFELGDDGRFEVRFGGFLRTMDQLVAVEDLDHAILGGAVADVYTVALGSGGHHPMH